METSIVTMEKPICIRRHSDKGLGIFNACEIRKDEEIPFGYSMIMAINIVHT